MKQNKIRIGIIGACQAGRTHLDVWKNIDDIDIVGFYEPDDDTANILAERYQVPRFLHP
jgi:predicted dehydrogenase